MFPNGVVSITSTEVIELAKSIDKLPTLVNCISTFVKSDNHQNNNDDDDDDNDDDNNDDNRHRMSMINNFDDNERESDSSAEVADFHNGVYDMQFYFDEQRDGDRIGVDLHLPLLLNALARNDAGEYLATSGVPIQWSVFFSAFFLHI